MSREQTTASSAAPPEFIPCQICGEPTRMLGTKRCDRCWELETRVRMNPELARKILEETKKCVNRQHNGETQRG